MPSLPEHIPAPVQTPHWRYSPVLHPLAYKSAQYAAEVLVTGVAEKAAGVGEHTDKVAQQAEICETYKLIPHALLVVVEPPGTAVLQLACHLCALERADDRIDKRIVGGVEAVDDCAGQLVLTVKNILAFFSL